MRDVHWYVQIPEGLRNLARPAYASTTHLIVVVVDVELVLRSGVPFRDGISVFTSVVYRKERCISWELPLKMSA